MLIPGQNIILDDETKTELGRHLVNLIDATEDQHGSFLKNVSVWWEWYDAEPLVDRRMDPWPDASNIVVPLIRYHTDAVTARVMNTIYAADRLWVGKNRNEDIKDYVEPVTQFLNWASDDNDFDTFMPSLDWINEGVPIGSSVMSLNWVARYEQMILPGDGGKNPQFHTVQLSNGPFWQQVPREQIIWQMDRPIRKSEFVIRQSLMTYSDMLRCATLGPKDSRWDLAAIEEVKNKPMSGFGATAKIQRERKAGQGLTMDGPRAYLPHDVRECWVKWPLLQSMKVQPPHDHDPKTPLIPLVVTLHKDTAKILRVIAKPHYIQGWPFYDIYYRRESNRNNSAGVCKLLEHLQRGSSTIINQAIDSVTLANSLNFITRDRKLMNQTWKPNLPLYGNPDDLREIQLNKIVHPDIALLNVLLAMAERVNGIGDPNLGRETRLGGHPSPATNTLAFLQESSEMRRTMMKLVRRAYAQLAEDTGTLYQQFEVNKNNRIERAIGTGDAARVQKWAFPRNQPVGSIKFDLRAISETNNPEQERQTALFISQVTAQYYSQVMQALQIMGDQRATPIIRTAAERSIEALSQAYKRVLESSDVDDLENFMFKLREANGDRRAIDDVRQGLGERLGELASDRGERGLPAVPGGPDQVPLAPSGRASASGF
jgi:hypothetical protein